MKQSLRKWIVEFSEFLRFERQFSVHTITNYERDLLQFWEFVSDDPTDTLGALTPRVCRQFLMLLSQRNFSAKSVARKLAAFRSFWRFLMMREYATENPWEFISSPRLPELLPSVLVQEDMAAFLEGIFPVSHAALRDRAICELLYGAGLRVSELVGLNMSHVNFDTREMRILGKGKRERIGLFGEVSANWLKQYLDEVRGLWAEADQPAVFVNQKGGRLTVRSVQRMIHHYAEAQGLSQKVTPHTLRHSFATDLYSGGADLRDVQELLGHQSLSTTQIYTHLSDDHLQSVFHSAHPRA